MQLKSIDNVSFGKIGFTNRTVEKAFYLALESPKFTSLNKEKRGAIQRINSLLLDVENTRTDRVVKIGMKQIEGKDYFTNSTTDQVLGLTKNGSQNICAFLLDLLGK